MSARTRVSFVWLGSCGWVGSCIVSVLLVGGLVRFCGLAWMGARVWVWVSCVHVYEFVCGWARVNAWVCCYSGSSGFAGLCL